MRIPEKATQMQGPRAISGSIANLRAAPCTGACSGGLRARIQGRDDSRMRGLPERAGMRGLTGRMRGGILQNPHAVSRSSRRPYGEARHTGRDLAQGGGGKGVACRGTAQEGEMKSHRPCIGRRRRRGHAMRPPVPHGACSLRRSGAGKMGEGPREGVCAALGPPWVAAPAAGNRGGARSKEGRGRGGRAGYAAACAMTHLRALLSIAVPLWTATRIARMRLP